MIFYLYYKVQDYVLNSKTLLKSSFKYNWWLILENVYFLEHIIIHVHQKKNKGTDNGELTNQAYNNINEILVSTNQRPIAWSIPGNENNVQI